MRYLFIGVNNLKTFYTDIMFKRKTADSRVNNPKTIRIKDAQFPRFCFYMSIYVAQFPHLYYSAFKCVPKSL